MATEVIPGLPISSSYLVTPMPLAAGRLFDAALVRELLAVPPPKPPKPEPTAEERALAREARRTVVDKNAKIRRDLLRAAGRCINGPIDPAKPNQHGPVVRGGKCQACLDVHAGKKKTIYEQEIHGQHDENDHGHVLRGVSVLSPDGGGGDRGDADRARQGAADGRVRRARTKRAEASPGGRGRPRRAEQSRSTGAADARPRRAGPARVLSAA